MSDGLGSSAPTNPSDSWEPIVPDDNADLPRRNNRFPRAIHCGGNSGAVTMLDANGTSAVFYLGAGFVLPVRPSRVMATGTTATGLVAFY